MKVGIRSKKPVLWNSMVFESQSALGRHLRIYQPGAAVNKALKAKRELKGHIPTHVKKEVSNV